MKRIKQSATEETGGAGPLVKQEHNYTPPKGGEVRPAGASYGKQISSRCIPVAASYPFVDMPSENALLCKPIPVNKLRIYSGVFSSQM